MFFLNKSPDFPSRIYPLTLSLLSVLVGIVAALGAVGFRALISFFHNLLFLGQISFVYEANIHTEPGPWGPFVILVPVGGAMCVAFLVKTFAPEAKGHGVPEVMDSIYYHRGIIRPVVAVVKSLASALSIGSGGSVGREGPIIQIGSSFGSTLAQIVRVPTWQRVTLIACGTGAGIAATFNTPIGGVLFAVEVILHEVSVRTLVPVTIATATATYIGQMFFGVYPAFVIPEFESFTFKIGNPLMLASHIGLGIIMGGAATLYIRSIYEMEDFFEQRVRVNEIARHMIGMFLVGVLMYSLMVKFGHYYIEGVGYATIQDILTGRLSAISLMLLLFTLKLIVTSLTLGSGGSGGIFSPALFLGATLGGAYGTLLGWLFPSPAFNPQAFAIAGMAGLVGGSTGAAMAAIVMIFEMTLDYNVILPITITVAISNATRWLLLKDTIYTLKLSRRGHFMPEALETNYHYLQPARAIMLADLKTVSASASLQEFAKLVLKEDYPYFLVEEQGNLLGLITKDKALDALSDVYENILVKDLTSTSFVTVDEGARLRDIMKKMRFARKEIALVASRFPPRLVTDIIGIITREHIAVSIQNSTDLFD